MPTYLIRYRDGDGAMQTQRVTGDSIGLGPQGLEIKSGQFLVASFWQWNSIEKETK